MLQLTCNTFQPLPICMSTKTVVKTRTRQTIAMRNFNGINFCRIQRQRNFRHLGLAVLMLDGMLTIPQRNILNINLSHAISPF